MKGIENKLTANGFIFEKYRVFVLVLLPFLFFACSGGGESNASLVNGTVIKNKDIRFDGTTPGELLSSTEIGEIDALEDGSKLTITVSKVNYSGSDSWWFSICSDTSWKDEQKIDWLKGDGLGAVYSLQITFEKLLTTYSDGIYIAGTNGATATVTISYE